jgi:Fe-S oxidoreductase
MLQSAKDLAGVKKIRRGGKRLALKDATRDRLRESMCTARRCAHALHRGTPHPDLWTEKREKLMADFPKETEAPPETINSREEAARVLMLVRTEVGRRKKILDRHLKDQDRTRMRENIARKRQNLGSQKGSLQRAMGKGAMRAEMMALKSRHPDTMVVNLPPYQDPSAREILLALEEAGLPCSLTVGENLTARYTFHQRTDLADALILANLKGWNIGELEVTADIAHSPSDVLSCIEAELGDEGRSRRAVCPDCQQGDLRTLSRIVEGERTVVVYCGHCKRHIIPSIPPIPDEGDPWPQEIFAPLDNNLHGFPQIPRNPELSDRQSDIKFTDSSMDKDQLGRK